MALYWREIGFSSACADASNWNGSEYFASFYVCIGLDLSSFAGSLMINVSL